LGDFLMRLIHRIIDFLKIYFGDNIERVLLCHVING
jgi:hypothetical protein